MTRIVIRKNPAITKSRSALYMDADLHEALEQLAKELDVSFNKLCVNILRDRVEGIAEAPTAVKRKKRAAR